MTTAQKNNPEPQTVVTLRHSLSLMLARFGVVFALLFGVVIGIYQINIDYRHQQDELAQTVTQILQVVEFSAKQAVYEYDTALAHKVINGLFAFEPIVYVRISDDFGETLAQAGADRDNLPATPWWLPEGVLSGQKKFRIALKTADSIAQSKARLIITVERYYATAAFIERAVTILGAGIVRNVLLTVALLAIFHYLLSLPLLRLTTRLAAIDPQNPESKLCVSTRHQNNELGLLCNGINCLLKAIMLNVQQINSLNQSLEQRIEEINMLNQNLEMRIHQRTSALESKSQEAINSLQQLQETQQQLVEAEKNTALTGLVAGIAHEINTPLGVSVTAASSLKNIAHKISQQFAAGSITKLMFKKALAQLNDGADIILNNAQRAADLISSFKQVAVDQASYEQRTFRFKAYINEILATLQPRLKLTNIGVNVVCAKDFTITSYPGAIAQIVSNLVVNALFHGYESKQSGTITITIKQQDSRVLMNFCDDGKGIPPQLLSQIFNPFFTTKRSEGGSGLGLHIISNIVTNTLNGKIHCTSEADNGCCFHIAFSELKKAEQRTKQRTKQRTADTKRISES